MTEAIADRSRCHSTVLPAMSVNRKVTVPEGRSGMIRFYMCGLYSALSIVACHE